MKKRDQRNLDRIELLPKYNFNNEGYVSVSFSKVPREPAEKKSPKREVNVIFQQADNRKAPVEDQIEDGALDQDEILDREDISNEDLTKDSSEKEDRLSEGEDDQKSIEIEILAERRSNTKTPVPVEEDDSPGEADCSPPMQLYGKLRCDMRSIEEEDYDEGPTNDNLCYHITIPSKPSPTVALLKHEFLKAMGKNTPLKNVLIYHVSYQNNIKFGLGDIRYPDGRVGRFLDSDSKLLDQYNITNGTFFEIDIKV